MLLLFIISQIFQVARPPPDEGQFPTSLDPVRNEGRNAT